MDICLIKCFALLQKALINPPELCGALFMMDGWMHFILLQNLNHIHCHYKAWKSQDISLIQLLIVFFWKKKVIYTYDGLRVSKSWSN